MNAPALIKVENCRMADEFKARKIYFAALAAFRSNILDAADLSGVFREELIARFNGMDAHALIARAAWDEAMEKSLIGKETA